MSWRSFDLSIYLSMPGAAPRAGARLEGGVRADERRVEDEDVPAATDPLQRAPPPPPPRTKWTRRVPHPVLIGHAASAGSRSYRVVTPGTKHHAHNTAPGPRSDATLEPFLAADKSSTPHSRAIRAGARGAGRARKDKATNPDKSAEMIDKAAKRDKSAEIIDSYLQVLLSLMDEITLSASVAQRNCTST
jgi:hypothetical protein